MFKTHRQTISFSICDARTPEVNGDYTEDGDFDGKPAYKKIGDDVYEVYFFEAVHRDGESATAQRVAMKSMFFLRSHLPLFGVCTTG